MLTCPTTNNKYLLSGIILSGGKSRRMGGIDKGLIQLDHRSMIQTVINQFKDDCDQIVISANRNIEQYRTLNYPVFQDTAFTNLGPLSGIYECLKHVTSPYVLVSPCDTPYLPINYAQQLFNVLRQSKKNIAVSDYKDRLQPAHFLMKNNQKNNIEQYLLSGKRSLCGWHKENKSVTVTFNKEKGLFANINSAIDLKNM